MRPHVPSTWLGLHTVELENAPPGRTDMSRNLPCLCRIVGLAILISGAAHAVELPSTAKLRQQMTVPAQAVAVHEPHLSVGDRHVAIEYVGFPAVDVLERLFGRDWRRQGETVEFRALDGYVSRIAVTRFRRENAFLVFARKDGSAFTVDNLAQNQRDVPLGPYYLVWDNISNPALLKEGAGKWPYQVNEVNLVSLSDRALLPKGLDPRLSGGVQLAKTHCLSCHKINGFGGEKFEGNLAEIAKDMSEPEFVRWVLAPSSILSRTTMPPLSDRLAEGERQRIAKALFGYLRAVPVLP